MGVSRQHTLQNGYKQPATNGAARPVHLQGGNIGCTCKSRSASAIGIRLPITYIHRRGVWVSVETLSLGGQSRCLYTCFFPDFQIWKVSGKNGLSNSRDIVLIERGSGRSPGPATRELPGILQTFRLVPCSLEM